MTTLLDQLYQFAMENRVASYLTDQEYQMVRRYQNKRWEHLMERIDSSERKELEDYEEVRTELETYEERAAFCAGLSLGLELSRL